MIVAMETLYCHQHNAHDGNQPRGNRQHQLWQWLVLDKFVTTVVALGILLLSVMFPSPTFTFVQVEEEEPVADHGNGAGGCGIGNGAGHNN
jgi:hypothetical protein